MVMYQKLSIVGSLVLFAISAPAFGADCAYETLNARNLCNAFGNSSPLCRSAQRNKLSCADPATSDSDDDEDVAALPNGNAALATALAQIQRSTAEYGARNDAASEWRRQQDVSTRLLRDKQEADQDRLRVLNARVEQYNQQQHQLQQQPQIYAPRPSTDLQSRPVVSQGNDRRAHFTHSDSYESDGSGGLSYAVRVVNDGQVKLDCKATARGLIWGSEFGGVRNADGGIQSQHSTSAHATVYVGQTATVAGFGHVVANSGSYTVACDRAE
jgi:hypothetical protein